LRRPARNATLGAVHYTMSSKWSLMERFAITDDSGAEVFEARGHFRSKITLHDGRRHEVAEVRKHVFTDTHEVHVGGQEVAKVRHAGIFGDHYDIDTPYGRITAKGHFDGGDYHLDSGGMRVASIRRKLALREKFGVEIADGQNDVLLLAVMLAIEAIHEERREQNR
jgi:uncharacterized protein YxjI